MENTLNTFKAQQAKAMGILEKLQKFLAQGESVGVPVSGDLTAKLHAAIQSVAGEKLKIALIGGFSEGKTSIAAAWMEQLDKSSMNISHQESSNEVKVYEVGSDFVLIDTPGLFGFKEQFNDETKSVEKYKDITKKYVSEAHLILYVMNSTNPVKESHKEDLMWLFRTLNLLPRTVFVLSRFDEVADVEDEEQYTHNLSVKQKNVMDRLNDLITLTDAERNELAIVGVAANPFDMGTEHWLTNLEQFKELSHIASLQMATSEKIKSNGGAAAVANEAKKSVIRDVLTKQLPVVIANDEKIALEVKKLDAISHDLNNQLKGTEQKIAEAKLNLRSFIMKYFSDLILQAKGVDADTSDSFFEREVGSEGIIIAARLQNEFERQLQSVTFEVSSMKIGFEADIQHYNSTMQVFGRQGLDYVVKSNLISNTSVIAARDGITTVAKTIGLDLGKMLHFKPYGAINLAKGMNGALAFLGLAIEAWDSWEQAKREEAFRKGMQELINNFETQRADLNSLISGDQFTGRFFPEYIELKSSVHGVQKDAELKDQHRLKFHEWRKAGELIDSEFSESEI